MNHPLKNRSWIGLIIPTVVLLCLAKETYDARWFFTACFQPPVRMTINSLRSASPAEICRKRVVIRWTKVNDSGVVLKSLVQNSIGVRRDQQTVAKYYELKSSGRAVIVKTDTAYAGKVYDGVVLPVPTHVRELLTDNNPEKFEDQYCPYYIDTLYLTPNRTFWGIFFRAVVGLLCLIYIAKWVKRSPPVMMPSESPPPPISDASSEDEEMSDKQAKSPPPSSRGNSITPIATKLPNADNWFHDEAGFPRPDWQKVAEWVDANVRPEDMNETWQEISLVWLDRIRARLGTPYDLGQSANFVLLSSLDPQKREETLRFLEKTLAEVQRVLRGVATDEGFGKHVAIIFKTEDEYYQYISYFYPDEGEYAGSSGVFLHDGYMHFALLSDDLSRARPILVHELIHNCLAQLPLPRWLNEGVTSSWEHELRGGRSFSMDREMAERHYAFWNEETIQEFWSGKSIERVDDGNELTYNLAQLLVYRITHDIEPPPEAFREFVREADYRDAGKAAAKKCLGIELAKLIEDFLGSGEWDPQPDKWGGKKG